MGEGTRPILTVKKEDDVMIGRDRSPMVNGQDGLMECEDDVFADNIAQDGIVGMNTSEKNRRKQICDC